MNLPRRMLIFAMALNIKDERTDALARALAHEAGEPLTVATRIAIEERLGRLRAARTSRTTSDDLLAIIERGRHRPRLSDLAEDDILGYDASGIPS